MTKCRVYYRPDGTVAVVHPVFKARRLDETEQEFLDRAYAKAEKESGLTGLDFDDTDTANLPDRKDRDKWRGQKGQGVRVDPSVVTRAERRQAVEAQLDAELAKPNPNPVQALKLQRRLEKGEY